MALCCDTDFIQGWSHVFPLKVTWKDYSEKDIVVEIVGMLESAPYSYIIYDPQDESYRNVCPSSITINNGKYHSLSYDDWCREQFDRWLDITEKNFLQKNVNPEKRDIIREANRVLTEVYGKPWFNRLLKVSRNEANGLSYLVFELGGRIKKAQQ